MNSAKLRRSRDVSELYQVKVENRFKISNLAMLPHGFGSQCQWDELAHQATGLIDKSVLAGRRPLVQVRHISSGRQPTACPVGGVSTL
jgi:hypothetical protein